MDNSIFQRTLSDFSDSFTKVGKVFQFTKSFFVFFFEVRKPRFYRHSNHFPELFYKGKKLFRTVKYFFKKFLCVL